MSVSVFDVDKRVVSEMKIEKYTFQWVIKNFSYIHKRPGQKLESPTFSFGTKNEINWHLTLYPNGYRNEEKNYLSVFLSWEHNSIIYGRYNFSLINNEQKKQVEQRGYLRDKLVSSQGIGVFQLIKRDEVLNKTSGLLTEDSLTIHCEIFLSSDNFSLIREDEKLLLKVSPKPHFLEKLFLEKDLSDVFIATSCGKSLPAHRSILAANSPVFKTMFKNDMPEQKLVEIKIDNGDYEVIKEMLRFIYLSEVENLKSIVFELVKLADKYQIAGLVELCQTVLIDQIAVDNVLILITVADSYNLEQLKSHAIKFGSLHLKEVVNSEDFKSTLYPQAVQSVLEGFGKQP